MKEGKIKLGAVAITAILMLSMGMMLATVPDNAEGQITWWNTNYGQRLAYTVTNAESSGVTNITMDIYLTEAATPDIFDHCRSDGYDIEFIDSTHTTELEQYTAYWNYADHDAMFQVLVPSVPASSSTTVWIYYGNSHDTTDDGDPDAVFNLYDDFNYANYRNVTTDSMAGAAAMWSKYPTATYTPDTSNWNESYAKMRGITNTYNDTEGQIIAYGSYVNSSYNCILGMNNTDGYGTDWTNFDNVMVNHSADGSHPDFIKASEPDFLHLISDSWRRSCVKEYDSDNYAMLYTGLNVTNYSICMAYSPVFDAAWSKYASNPVISNGTLPYYDSGGVRKPVFWKDGETDYRCLFSAYNTTSTEWKIGYATSADMVTWSKPYNWPVFNGSNFGWDNGTVSNRWIYTTMAASM